MIAKEYNFQYGDIVTAQTRTAVFDIKLNYLISHINPDEVALVIGDAKAVANSSLLVNEHYSYVQILLNDGSIGLCCSHDPIGPRLKRV